MTVHEIRKSETWDGQQIKWKRHKSFQIKKIIFMKNGHQNKPFLSTIYYH